MTIKQNITPFTLTQKIIINESNIDDVFESICGTTVSNIQKSLGKSSCLSWLQLIQIIKRIKLSKKGLTNIQNIDDLML